MSEYHEPWREYALNQILDETNTGIATFDRSPDTYDQEYKKVKRVWRLINLFAGVSDEQIDKLTAKDNTVEDEPIYKLLFSLLTNDLADVPLAMLIDAIQNTREYQKQLETFRTWQELYNMLTTINNVFNNTNVRAAINGYPVNSGREVFDSIRLTLNEFLKVKEKELAPAE